MDRHFPRIGAGILFFAACLHALRFSTSASFGEIVPLWASVILSPVLFFGGIQYLLERDRIAPRWGGKAPYYLTAIVFLVASAIHGYRILVDSTILRIVPSWASALAIPCAILLTAYNLSVKVR